MNSTIKEPGNTVKNKTGSWRTFRPVWDSKKCIQCGLCWVYCPDNAIPIKGKKRGKTDLNYCKGCLICVEACPVKAISARKEEK